MSWTQPTKLKAAAFELEDAMRLAQYRSSRPLSRIDAADYQSCEDDGRDHVITMTDAGKAIRRRTWAIHSRAIEAAIGQHFSDDEADNLSKLLQRLRTTSASSH